MYDFIANLRWRGMIHDITPGLEAQLQKEMITGYIGFDPTAPSLHVGNLATIMLLKHFQLAGHKPVAVVGGATGMIGDPSFKATERKFLSEEELLHNQSCIMKQLKCFLDFSPCANAAELLNNIDWFKDFGFLRFLREVGKHISINYMMAKESVKRRLEDGISFTEFSYQLLQGYDFYYLYNTKGVKLQMGGTDQWGNLTTGIELIRRKTGEESFALTAPLITKADGTKFGKSEQGNIWLDPTMTSPYEFYQFWLNCTDEDACRLIKVFTLLSKEEIDNLIELHVQAPHQRILQKQIAKELTIRVHSETDYMQARKTSELLFGHATAEDLWELSEKDFKIIFKSIPEIHITLAQLTEVEHMLDLIASTGSGIMFNSKGEVRRAIQEGSLSVNKEKITDPLQKPNLKLLQDKYLLVQRGKKHHYLIKVS
ncbi:MAG: tyrosine--tRNA ligase [Candidatus Amoebophilus sp.]